MRAWAISFFVCFWLASPVAAEKRVALVIGNASYRHITSLDNATSDAQLMAAALRGLDFTLVGDNALLDLDKAEFDGVVQLFCRRSRDDFDKGSFNNERNSSFR